MTIDELLRNRELGAYRIRHLRWPTEFYFYPIFRDPNGVWHGPDQNGFHISSVVYRRENENEWELYYTPKKRWLWVDPGDQYRVSTNFWSEEQAEDINRARRAPKPYIKLLYTEMEFEE